jgi:preprotein translocase subunit SecG
MKEESECFRASVSPTIHTKLAEIKKKIDDTVAEIKKENQNILNTAANTTIIQRDKTLAEKWASLDDDILAQVKKILGDYYYPVVYVFWCFIILVAVLMVFKFAFLFISPGGGGGGGGGGIDGGNGDPNRSGTNMSLLGIVIMVLIVIFAVYYYFSYTYNLDVNITHNDTVYTTV